MDEGERYEVRYSFMCCWLGLMRLQAEMVKRQRYFTRALSQTDYKKNPKPIPYNATGDSPHKPRATPAYLKHTDLNESRAI